jgi:Protein of unknown function (DUF3040)
MALSMDEQRILAEIERKLAADDPALAGSLSAFSRPGLSAGLRTPRSRVLASVIVVAVIALTSLMVYSFSPIRILQHQSRSTSRPAQKRSEQTVTASQAASSQAAARQQTTAAGQAGASGAQRKAPAAPARKSGAAGAASPSAQPSALPNATASPG